MTNEIPPKKKKKHHLANSYWRTLRNYLLRNYLQRIAKTASQADFFIWMPFKSHI